MKIKKISIATCSIIALTSILSTSSHTLNASCTGKDSGGEEYYCDDSKDGTCVEFRKGGETILTCSGIRCYTNPIVEEIDDSNENGE